MIHELARVRYWDPPLIVQSLEWQIPQYVSNPMIHDLFASRLSFLVQWYANCAAKNNNITSWHVVINDTIRKSLLKRLAWGYRVRIFVLPATHKRFSWGADRVVGESNRSLKFFRKSSEKVLTDEIQNVSLEPFPLNWDRFFEIYFVRLIGTPNQNSKSPWTSVHGNIDSSSWITRILDSLFSESLILAQNERWRRG